MTLSIVILAAGQGKRMHSQLPKVLHQLAGKTLLEHVVATAYQLNPEQSPFVIYGHQGEQVRQTLSHLNVTWIQQKEQLGTGHAVLQALPSLPENDRVLILYGDVPLVSTETLKQFIAHTPANALGIITAQFTNPNGFGRVIRNTQQHITHIVEEKDANTAERSIHEINSGIYLIPAKQLHQWLPKLSNDNAQREYYLTDIIKYASQDNIAIHSTQPMQCEEVYGINDRLQLANLERFYQRNCAEQLMLKGVTLIDPNRFDLRGELNAGQDVIIDINVIIEGKVTIGNNCRISANCILRDVIIADNVEIKANSIIEGADIGTNCMIGPFARLRPGTELSTNVHIGNFVEVKKSWVGQDTKINHLSYIGDSEIGKSVNVGAGTITCNYDGVNKHKTTVKDHVFIGSNSSLVAPVTLGEGATIGAGSTITHDAPAHQLTIGRARQCTIENWERPMKKEKES